MKNDEVRLFDSTGQYSTMFYSPDTDPKVVTILERYYHSDVRLRIWIGDTERSDFESVHNRKPDPGLAWDEEFDVIGTIGRSTGMKPIPLLINNSRSYGGPAIMTDCIIRIMTTSGRELYKHPNYHSDMDSASVKPSELAHEGYTHAVVPSTGEYAGQEVARFRSERAAINYLAFMQGKRMCK